MELQVDESKYINLDNLVSNMFQNDDDDEIDTLTYQKAFLNNYKINRILIKNFTINFNNFIKLANGPIYFQFPHFSKIKKCNCTVQINPISGLLKDYSIKFISFAFCSDRSFKTLEIAFISCSGEIVYLNSKGLNNDFQTFHCDNFYEIYNYINEAFNWQFVEKRLFN